MYSVESVSITDIIILVTAGVSIVAFYSHDLMYKWIFSAYQARYNKQYYRFITSGFLHANWLHLFLNMYVLYMFGNFVEKIYTSPYIFDFRGYIYYMVLYVGALIVSNLPSFFKYHNDPAYQSLGASGAVSAVLFTFILIAPFESLYFFGIIRLPAWLFGLGYMIYEYWAGRRQADNINHDAHLIGGLFGLVFNIIVRPEFVVEFVNQVTGRI